MGVVDDRVPNETNKHGKRALREAKTLDSRGFLTTFEGTHQSHYFCPGENDEPMPPCAPVVYGPAY